jgi:hypothetical protein
MTLETGKRPNGAAAAILAVRPLRSPRRDYYEGIPRLGAAAAATLYANVRASFSPIRHSHRAPGVFKGLNCGAHARQDRVEILES